LRLRARVARDGIQEYTLPNGSKRREYRSADMLRQLAPLLRSVPITEGHPPSRLLAAEDLAEHSLGHIEQVLDDLEEHDGHRWLVADLVLNRPRGVKLVTNRTLVETSLGRALGDQPFTGPGKTETGEHYDAGQPCGLPNHLALLPPNRARAGRECRLLLDSLDEYLPPTEEESQMEVEKLLTRIAELEAKITSSETLRTELDTLRVELDEARSASEAEAAKAAEATAQLDAIDLPQLVAEEIAFIDKLRPHLPSGYAFTSRSQAQLDSLEHLGVKLPDGKATDADYVSTYLEARIAALPPKGTVVVQDAKPTADEIRASKRAAVAARGAK
jgi:hypothetical protein